MKRDVFPCHASSFVLRATSAMVVLLAMLVMSVFRVSVGAAHAAGGGQHAPIVIQSDTGFMTCSCVVSGTGSTTDPLYWLLRSSVLKRHFFVGSVKMQSNKRP